jgi:hypothetical protein
MGGISTKYLLVILSDPECSEGATPLPQKISVFQPAYFLFPSTFYAFQTRLFAAQNLLQKNPDILLLIK